MSFRIFSLLLFLISSVSAQTKSTSGGIHVRFLAEQTPEGLGKVFLHLGEVKSESFDLPTRFLSESVPVGARPMALKTVEKEVTLCSITLPETGGSFAVVLVAAKPAGYGAIFVRTDDPAFKAGDVFFINQSDKIVLGKLGTAPLVLKPGDTAKSRPTGPVDNAYYDIAFAVRSEKGDKLISSSRWPIDNNLRSYLVFFNDAKGRTTFRAIDEHLVGNSSANP